MKSVQNKRPGHTIKKAQLSLSEGPEVQETGGGAPPCATTCPNLQTANSKRKTSEILATSFSIMQKDGQMGERKKSNILLNY